MGNTAAGSPDGEKKRDRDPGAEQITNPMKPEKKRVEYQ